MDYANRYNTKGTEVAKYRNNTGNLKFGKTFGNILKLHHIYHVRAKRL